MNSLTLTEALFQSLPPYQNSKGKIEKSARSCPACHSGKLNFSGDKYFFNVCGCSYADIYKAGRKFLGGDFDTSEYKEKQELKRQEQARIRAEKLQGKITPAQLDQAIRSIANSLGLRQKHFDKLIQRGFSPDQVKEKLFFSISKGENDLPPGIAGNFPGVNNNGKLYSSRSGIACVFIGNDNKALSWQIRDDDPASENKYTWLYDSKVKVNSESEELAINVFLPPAPAPIKLKNNTVILTEGGPIKGNLAGYRFNVPVISAAGGYFSASPIQCQQAIQQLGVTNVVIAIDGGDICNDHRRLHWKKEVSFLENLGVTVSILWYQQWEKNGLDLDEISPDQLFSNLQLLTLKEWLSLDYQHWKLGEIRKQYRKLSGAKLINVGQKYLDLSAEYPNIAKAKLVCIIAPTGAGKTEANLKLAKETFGGNLNNYLLLNLTYLNSLSRGLQGRSNNLFKHLQDLENIPKNTNFSFCHQSLIKFAHKRHELRGRRVFIDEIVSVVENMLTGSNVQDRFLIFELFRELLRYAEKVIISDANLSDTEVNFIKDLMGIDDSQVLILEKPLTEGNKYKVIIRNTIYYDDQKKIMLDKGKDSEGQATKEILALLGEGKKIIVTSDSQKDLETIHRKALEKYPNLKIRRIDSKTVRNADKVIEQVTEDFLKNPDKIITEEQPDLLLISPLCNSGVDISIKDYFFRQYHLTRGVLNVNATAQLLNRLRDTEVEKHIFFLRPNTKEYFPNIDDIFHNDARLEASRSDAIRERVASALSAFSDSDQDISEREKLANKEAERLINQYIQEFKLARKLDILNKFEKTNIKELLPEYLRDKGYTVSEKDYVLNINIDKSFQKTKEEIKKGDAEAIYKADYIGLDTPPDQLPNIDQVPFVLPEEDRTTLNPDSVGLLNLSYRHRLPGIEQLKSWDADLVYLLHFTDKKLIDRLSLYHLLQNPDRASNLKLSRTRKYLNSSPDFIENYDRLTPIIEVLQYLGIDKLVSRTTPYSGNDDQIKEIVAKYKNKKNRLSGKARELLGINPDKIGNCQLVAMILGKIAVSTKGEKKEKEVKGERVTWTEYSVTLPGTPRYKKQTKQEIKDGIAPELIPSPIPDLMGCIDRKFDRYSADKFNNIDDQVIAPAPNTCQLKQQEQISDQPIPQFSGIGKENQQEQTAADPIDSINTFNPAPAPITPAGTIAEKLNQFKPGDFVRFADGWDDIKYQIISISSKGVAKVRGLYGSFLNPTIDALIPA